MGKRNQPKEENNYNIANVHADIDYDMLAMAIVKAKKIAAEEENKLLQEARERKRRNIEEFSLKRWILDILSYILSCKINIKNLLKAIGKGFKILFKGLCILLKMLICLILAPAKFYNNSKMVGHLMVLSTPLSFVYEMLSWFFLIIGLLLIVAPFKMTFDIFNFLVCWTVAIFAFVIRSGFVIARKEIESTNDIQIVATLFSTIVSFVAMIVAIVSVFVTLKLGAVI